MTARRLALLRRYRRRRAEAQCTSSSLRSAGMDEQVEKQRKPARDAMVLMDYVQLLVDAADLPPRRWSSASGSTLSGLLDGLSPLAAIRARHS